MKIAESDVTFVHCTVPVPIDTTITGMKIEFQSIRSQNTTKMTLLELKLLETGKTGGLHSFRINQTHEKKNEKKITEPLAAIDAAPTTG